MENNQNLSPQSIDDLIRQLDILQLHSSSSTATGTPTSNDQLSLQCTQLIKDFVVMEVSQFNPHKQTYLTADDIDMSEPDTPIKVQQEGQLTPQEVMQKLIMQRYFSRQHSDSQDELNRKYLYQFFLNRYS